MKTTAAFVAAIVFGAACSAHADYSVADKGTWPNSWPKELEPLRKQARTLEGPLGPHQHYAITDADLVSTNSDHAFDEQLVEVFGIAEDDHLAPMDCLQAW